MATVNGLPIMWGGRNPILIDLSFDPGFQFSSLCEHFVSKVLRPFTARHLSSMPRHVEMHYVGRLMILCKDPEPKSKVTAIFDAQRQLLNRSVSR